MIFDMNFEDIHQYEQFYLSATCVGNLKLKRFDVFWKEVLDLNWRQSYEINLVPKKAKLVWNSLTVINLDYNNTVV